MLKAKPSAKPTAASATRQKTFSEMLSTRPDTPLLDTIDSPADLKHLTPAQLVTLADELRAFLLYSTGVSGGHFGANLGVVELTIALHYVFNAPHDQLVWDVGHQAYPHKILTGRRERLTSIRSQHGLTAFPERGESQYDSFGVGHSSTAISAGLGMSLAMRYLGKSARVACVVGDGAMTGGMAFEAMNDAVNQNADLLVVLNDNDMSISNATGGFSKHLAMLWQRGLAVDIDKNGNAIITKRSIASDDRRIRHYLHMANDAFGDISSKIPSILGEKISEKVAAGEFPPTPSQLETLPEKLATKIADNLFPENVFKAIGFQYFGPFDGHDIEKLTQVFERTKRLSGAVLVHVHTVKGKGFLPAEGDPITYHAIGKLATPKATANQPAQPIKVVKKYSQVFGEFICDTAERDQRLMAITPAMAEGSGMVEFAKRFPTQFFDVAIAEQHAVTLAAGMATQGVKPIVAIYSTFLQRGYDQLIHDVALQNLNVMFAIDRAGLVGEDGATHAGVFDMAYLRCVPNIIIAVPKDENECYNLLKTCYAQDGVTAVRYPRGTGTGAPIDKTAAPYPIGKAVLEATFNAHDTNAPSDNALGDNAVALLAFGTMTLSACQAAQILSTRHPTRQIRVYNMRFVKPLDSELLAELLQAGDIIVTLEEHQVMGGAGSAVNEALLAQAADTGKASPTILNIGIEDYFVAHGSHSQQLATCGLNVQGIVGKIDNLLGKLA